MEVPINLGHLRDRLEASGDLRGLVYNFCLFVDNRLPATEHVGICHFIESNVLRVAQRGQYTAVITNNTNPVTQVLACLHRPLTTLLIQTTTLR